jgi:putative membrane protein
VIAPDGLYFLPDAAFRACGHIGLWTLLLVLPVSYTFFSLDALGDQLENPFGSPP